MVSTSRVFALLLLPSPSARIFQQVTMSATTATAITTKLKQFNGTGFPAWGVQDKLALEMKWLWSDVPEEPLPQDGITADPKGSRHMLRRLRLERPGGTLAAGVYLLEHPLVMLRSLLLSYNVKCSAGVGAAKREYMGLYLDDGDSMVEHIKTTKRVIDEVQDHV
ncbi:Hypothetical protein PHPALM_84 [Phytophthora palmivora]|uniref:Uncharacterized protein n=1 Tax=Phytophthora palmivora TaxID=4796 RepID=A0A2P4YVQ9_9STRA|nr:Hypothetical protein PHPALM_84 [Phytophthora palmivora]